MSLDPQVRPLPASSRARGARRTLRQAALGAALLAAVAGAPPARAQQPFIGEIRLVPFNFAPVGWAFCDGQLMAISENTALFALIGTTYGGDGQTTFALPDLRSRVPVHAGPGFVLGQAGGVETVTLTVNQIPAHTHAAAADNNAGTAAAPDGKVWAASNNYYQFAPASGSPSAMNAGAVGLNGGSQPHDNMLPFLAVNFILSLFGIFPSQN